MLNVDTWLKTTGLPVAENNFRNAQNPPFIVFLDSRKITGSDDANLLLNRLISVELYTSRIDSISEKLIEDLLDEKAFSYQKDRTFISIDSTYLTTYEFSITERK